MCVCFTTADLRNANHKAQAHSMSSLLGQRGLDADKPSLAPLENKSAIMAVRFWMQVSLGPAHAARFAAFT